MRCQTAYKSADASGYQFVCFSDYVGRYLDAGFINDGGWIIGTGGSDSGERQTIARFGGGGCGRIRYSDSINADETPARYVVGSNGFIVLQIW